MENVKVRSSPKTVESKRKQKAGMETSKPERERG